LLKDTGKKTRERKEITSLGWDKTIGQTNRGEDPPKNPQKRMKGVTGAFSTITRRGKPPAKARDISKAGETGDLGSRPMVIVAKGRIPGGGPPFFNKTKQTSPTHPGKGNKGVPH